MGGQSSRSNRQPGRPDPAVGDSNDEGRGEQWQQVRFDFDRPDRAPATLADADERRHAGRAPEPRRRQVGRAPTEGPGQPLGEPSGSRLSLSASERQGWDAADAGYWPPDRSYAGEWPGELEPAVRRVADGMAPWVDRLRLTGNGVVPLAAAVAFLRLHDRLMALPANGEA